MNVKDLLNQYKNNKTRVIVNGMGTGNTRGLILEVNDDYITYELLNVQTEKNSQKGKETREIKYIPILSISDISEGEKVKETKPASLSAAPAPVPKEPGKEPKKEEAQSVNS